MTEHLFYLLIAGLAVLGMYELPRRLEQHWLSPPMLYILFGMGLYALPIDYLPHIHPVVDGSDNRLLEYMSELMVIISLAGAGIQIDQAPSWARWRVGARMIGIAMPLCIGAIALIGWGLLGLTATAAILLGAVLAPTDPVLASSVKVGPPTEGEEDPVRFSLTLEAGLNDGLAFPFVYLALALVLAGEGATLGGTLLQWAAWDLLYRIGMGVAVGIAMGYFFHYVFVVPVAKKARAEAKKKELDEDDPPTGLSLGLLALAGTLLVYVGAELLEGYGFLAVFVTAVVSRKLNQDDHLHLSSYEFVDQIEQLLLGIFLIVLGGMIMSGLFNVFSWMQLLAAALFVLLVRPVTSFLALLGMDYSRRARAAISFLGIRGIGSIYYLAYAQGKATFEGIEVLWSVVGLTILLSIILHGVSAEPWLRYVERRPIRSKSIPKSD